MKKIIAIDIGNTRTHAAIVDIDAVCADNAASLCECKTEFNNIDFDNHFLQTIKNIIAHDENICGVNISSCVKTLADRAVSFLKSINTQLRVTVVKYHAELPIRINYDDPQTLGTDRLCAALACARLFPNETCIIIDAGTAITVDYLRNGKNFDGGAILPGVEMQKRALYNGADAICEHNNNIANNNIIYPSKSTNGCVDTGIIYGITGAIEKVGRENKNAKIISCGGSWEIIEPYVANLNITNISDLTLIGVGLYD